MPKARFKQVTIDVDKVIPNPKNPRIALRPGNPHYEKLRNSIEHYDYIDPIIWNKRTGMIVSGHQRFQVMKDIAEANGEVFDKVDVMQVDMPENEQDSFMVAVNKLTGLWDMEKLKALFEELSEEDLSYTGYDTIEIDAILHSSEEDIPDYDDMNLDDPPKEKFVLHIVCKDEEEQQALLEEMEGRGYQCRI